MSIVISGALIPQQIWYPLLRKDDLTVTHVYSGQTRKSPKTDSADTHSLCNGAFSDGSLIIPEMLPTADEANSFYGC